MPDVRERKKGDKIKEKSNGKSGLITKDVCRQMTVKLKKELMERQRNRDAGGNIDQPPKAQAAGQAEETIYTTADSIRDRTDNSVSKSISRHKRKQQRKKQRMEPATGETPPARDRMWQAAAASTSTARATPTVATGRAAARPLEQAKRRVQRNAQRKLLQQSAKKTKTAVDLSRKAATATIKAVSSIISAIDRLLGGVFLIPMICLSVLVGQSSPHPSASFLPTN